MKQGKIAFVGTGIIGTGLAVNAMIHGYKAALYDIAAPETVQKNVQDTLDILVECGLLDGEKTGEVLARASYTQSLEEAVTGAIFVQECVPERLDIKQDTYRKVQEIIGNSAVIASSTTGILPSKLQAGALYPDKILVGHPYNPSYLLPLIEVCGGEQTSAESVACAKEVYTGMGKVPVVCRKEHEGFVVNTLNHLMAETAKKLVGEGLCSVEDMDKAIMYGPGMRMAVTGQLLTIGLGIAGGFSGKAVKYGETPDPLDVLVDKGIAEEIANRAPAKGNTPEAVCRYRDKFLAEIVKLHGLDG